MNIISDLPLALLCVLLDIKCLDAPCDPTCFGSHQSIPEENCQTPAHLKVLVTDMIIPIHYHLPGACHTYLPGWDSSFIFNHSRLKGSYMHHKAQSKPWEKGGYLSTCRSSKWTLSNTGDTTTVLSALILASKGSALNRTTKLNGKINSRSWLFRVATGP